MSMSMAMSKQIIQETELFWLSGCQCLVTRESLCHCLFSSLSRMIFKIYRLKFTNKDRQWTRDLKQSWKPNINIATALSQFIVTNNVQGCSWSSYNPLLKDNAGGGRLARRRKYFIDRNNRSHGV